MPLLFPPVRPAGWLRPSHVSRLAIGALALAAAGCAHSGPPTTAATPAMTPAQRAEQAAKAAVAAEQTVDVGQLPANTIAIPPLSVQVSDTALAPLGYGLADLLATDLARSPKLVVVERLRLDAIMREAKLAQSGAVDSATAPRLGKLTGARRLEIGVLAGDAAGVNGELRIDLRIADVASGEVTKVVSAHAPVEKVLDAEVELALRTFDALGIVLTPAEQDAIQQNRTKNFAALLAYSRGVRSQAQGEYAEAAAEYRAALQADPSFTPAKANLSNVEVPNDGAQLAGAPAGQPTTKGTEGGTPAGGGLGDFGGNLGGTVNSSPADVSGGGTKGAASQGNASQSQNGAPADAVPVRIIIPIKRTP